MGAQDRHESLVAAWSETAASFGLRYEVFAPAPAEGRLARLGQRFSGKAAGVQFGRNRIGHVLSGRIGDVDMTVVAGTRFREGGGTDSSVSAITHYRAAAPWLCDRLRVGPRRPGVKDPLRYAHGGSTGWEWLDIGEAADLLVRAGDESAARRWLDRQRIETMRSAFSLRADVRVVDGGVETETTKIDAEPATLSANLRAVHDLALQLRHPLSA